MTEHLNLVVKTLKLEVLDRKDSLKIVKEKTGVNPSIICLVLGTILLICLVLSPTAVPLVTAVTCFLLPAYFTVMAIESEGDEDDIKYLVYWIMFGVLEVFSPIATLMIDPVYYSITRAVIVAVLIHPETNLSGIIYHNLIKPMLKK